MSVSHDGARRAGRRAQRLERQLTPSEWEAMRARFPKLDLGRLRLAIRPWWWRFTGHGVRALTLGSRIYLAEGLPAAADRRARLLAHELTHAEQYLRLGLLRFLWRYLGEYLGGRRRGLTHDCAYRAISLEREAYELECEERS